MAFDPKPYLKELARGPGGTRDLTREQAATLFAAVLRGEVADLALGALLVAYRVKGETADELAGMMQNVVEQGTGTAAQLEGVDVAGKTGTAEVGDGTDDLWFIGFTGKVAVVAMLERQTGGTGGANGAPSAGEALKALGE